MQAPRRRGRPVDATKQDLILSVATDIFLEHGFQGASMNLVASRAGGEACVCEVSEGVAVSQPTISHHLKVLRDAGLLTSQRRGSWVYYAVIPQAVHILSAALAVRTTTISGAPA